MKLINDIIAILTSLSFVDYILYFSVLALLILTVALIYVLKSEDNDNTLIGSDKMNEKKEIDLQAIANSIVEKTEPLIDMTAYEEEQEQKAIISYDELIKKSNDNHLKYEEEKLIDNVIPTKKISLSDIINEKNEETNVETSIVHYEREEAFLNTLKELNSLLN